MRVRLLALTAAALAVTGCAMNPVAIPVPGDGPHGPTYRVHIQFANALNLPDRAAVIADGVRIGTLTGVMLVDPAGDRPGYVVADADIATTTRLPLDTTAQLRQNTVLGDIYIALTSPPGSAGPGLDNGATIPLTHTRPAVQIEDTLAGIATFVSGGAVTRMQDIIDQANAALPADPRDTARMADVVASDLTDLSADLGTIHEFAAAADADLQVVRDNAARIRELFSADDARQVTDATTSLAHLFDVFGGIAGFAHEIAWLAPLAQAGDTAAAALLPLLFTGRPLDLTAPSNLNRFVSLLREKILPFVEQGPKVNITAVRTDTAGQDQLPAIMNALRMIGAVR